MNTMACFGCPLPVRDHTLKQIFYCAEKKVTTLNCEETFVADGTYNVRGKCRTESRDSKRHGASKLARKYKFPLLSMSTVIVRFNIGKCLHQPPPAHDDDASVFEVWTTLRVAEEGRDHPLELLTNN
jgi:hypothetical protein